MPISHQKATLKMKKINLLSQPFINYLITTTATKHHNSYTDNPLAQLSPHNYPSSQPHQPGWQQTFLPNDKVHFDHFDACFVFSYTDTSQSPIHLSHTGTYKLEMHSWVIFVRPVGTTTTSTAPSEPSGSTMPLNILAHTCTPSPMHIDQWPHWHNCYLSIDLRLALPVSIQFTK